MRREPCVLTRSPTISGRGSWRRAIAAIALATAGRHTGWRRRGVDARTASTSWRMCSGVVPQQPPTTLAPKSRTNAAICSAISDAPERVDGLAVDVQRQPGVRHHDDGQVALLRQVAHGLAEVLRPHRAVRADDVAADPAQDRCDGGDVRAEQHPAGHVEGHGDLQRHAPAGVLEGQPGALHRGAGLQDVLHGLDLQQVDAALQQRARPARGRGRRAAGR